jgi:hypothetical protein
LPLQIETLQAWCEREGYEVLEAIEDSGQSGASLERPGMDHVRDLVESGGVGVVIAQERDRFAREPHLVYLLKCEFTEHGTKIHPRRAHHDRCGRHLLARAVDDPQGTRSARADRRSTPCAPDILTAARLVALSIAALVALSLPACGNGSDNSESTSETSSGSTLLPRNVVLTLGEVKEVLPEITKETATGEDESALGNTTGTRSVTYATDDSSSQRVVISVAHYQISDDASSAFQEAVQGSLEAPGGEGETVSDLGEEAFIGTSAQGGETHVGGGALYGDLIVIVTLQGYDGTNKNKAKVTELIRMQAAAAKRAL